MKPITRVFLGMFGTGGLLFSLPCIAAMIHDMTIGGDNTSGTLLILVMMTVLAIPSLFAVYKALKSPPPAADAATLQNEENTERVILQMARIRNGRVSATHIAMQTPLTIDQATRALKSLEQRGLVYSEVTIHGGTEFVFPDLLAATSEFDQFDDKLANQDHILDLDSARQEVL